MKMRSAATITIIFVAAYSGSYFMVYDMETPQYQTYSVSANEHKVKYTGPALRYNFLEKIEKIFTVIYLPISWLGFWIQRNDESFSEQQNVQIAP